MRPPTRSDCAHARLTPPHVFQHRREARARSTGRAQGVGESPKSNETGRCPVYLRFGTTILGSNRQGEERRERPQEYKKLLAQRMQIATAKASYIESVKAYDQSIGRSKYMATFPSPVAPGGPTCDRFPNSRPPHNSFNGNRLPCRWPKWPKWPGGYNIFSNVILLVRDSPSTDRSAPGTRSTRPTARLSHCVTMG